MHKKSFAFGMGIGILSLTLIFFFLYGYQKSVLIGSSNGNAVKMSEQEIISEAKKLGMAFYLNDKEALPPQTEMTDDQIMQKALELGMSFTGGEEETNDKHQNEDDKAQSSITNEPIPTDNTQDTNEEQKTDKAVQTIKQNNDNAENQEFTEGAFDEETLVVYIPKGAISTEISEILFENGIIKNKDEFNDFLINKNSTKILGFGERRFPHGSSFDEILTILTQ